MGKIIHVDFRTKSLKLEKDLEENDLRDSYDHLNDAVNYISPNPPVDFQARLEEAEEKRRNVCSNNNWRKCNLCLKKRKKDRIYKALAVAAVILAYVVVTYGLK